MQQLRLLCLSKLSCPGRIGLEVAALIVRAQY